MKHETKTSREAKFKLEMDTWQVRELSKSRRIIQSPFDIFDCCLLEMKMNPTTVLWIYLLFHHSRKYRLLKLEHPIDQSICLEIYIIFDPAR